MTTPLRQFKNTYRWAYDRFQRLRDGPSKKILDEARQKYVDAFNQAFRTTDADVGMVDCPNDDMIMFVRLDGCRRWRCSGCGAKLPVVTKELHL